MDLPILNDENKKTETMTQAQQPLPTPPPPAPVIEQPQQQKQDDHSKLKALMENVKNKTMKPEDVIKQTDVNECVTKKVCAIEVMKHLNLSKIVAMGAIGGIFLILLSATFNRMISYVVALLLIVPAAVYLQKINAEIKRLKLQYGV